MEGLKTSSSYITYIVALMVDVMVILYITGIGCMTQMWLL